PDHTCAAHLAPAWPRPTRCGPISKPSPRPTAGPSDIPQAPLRNPFSGAEGSAAAGGFAGHGRCVGEDAFFGGIAPSSVPGFVLFELVGMVIAIALVRTLYPDIARVPEDVVVPAS